MMCGLDLNSRCINDCIWAFIVSRTSPFTSDHFPRHNVIMCKVNFSEDFSGLLRIWKVGPIKQADKFDILSWLSWRRIMKLWLSSHALIYLWRAMSSEGTQTAGLECCWHFFVYWNICSLWFSDLSCFGRHLTCWINVKKTLRISLKMVPIYSRITEMTDYWPSQDNFRYYQA